MIILQQNKQIEDRKSHSHILVLEPIGYFILCFK